MSRRISHPTYKAAYTPFTPSKSEQRLLPPYYRGCWHGVCRSFLLGYRQTAWVLSMQLFFSHNRALQPEGLHHPRGVAWSGFPPLPKPLDCCLPKESGPYLNPSVADHPLRPATHHSLGELLPHQQANGPRAHPQAVACKQRPPLITRPEDPVMLFGISIPLGMLSPTQGQITHVLLTRLPLY